MDFEAPGLDVLATVKALAVFVRIDAAERGFYLAAALLCGLAIRGDHPLLLHRVDSGKPTDRLVEIDRLRSFAGTGYELRQLLVKLLQRPPLHLGLHGSGFAVELDHTAGDAAVLQILERASNLIQPVARVHQ